jgi:NADH:ubiquinone oxidoreductase subunit 6 (subunit J)
MVSSVFLIKLLISILLNIMFCFATWGVFSSRFLIQKIFLLILVFNLIAYSLLVNGLEFLALIILLLYVGAIAVLILFVLMILNPDYQMVLEEKRQLTLMYKGSINESKIISFNVEKFYFSPLFLGILMGGIVYIQTFYVYNLPGMIFFNNIALIQSLYFDLNSTVIENLNVSFTIWQNSFQPIIYQNFEVINISTMLYTIYGAGVILVGLIILLAMKGAILLTLRTNERLKKSERLPSY